MIMPNFKFKHLLIGLAIVCAGCAADSPSDFGSPQEAVDTFVTALRAHDTEKLKAILGPGSDEILASGDEVSDRAEVQRFLEKYDAHHAFQDDSNRGLVLVVGEDDWPFPVPLVKKEHGYDFDTAAGKQEILDRRVGRNELDAEQVCLAIVDAERDYVALNPTNATLPVYARKIMSDADQKNGLYWPTGPDEAESPLGPLVAKAAGEGYHSTTRTANDPPPPYHGYRYRLLTKQGPNAKGGAIDYEVDGKLIGGFAVVAYPAEYGNSGITTFITNHDGVVYQRDLGQDTDKIAAAMTEFDPDSDWSVSTDSTQVSDAK